MPCANVSARNILHILSPCFHHNAPLSDLLLEFNQYANNEYVVLDNEGTFDAYRQLTFKAKELFSSNAGLLPWLRIHFMHYDAIVIHGFFNQVLWELLEENKNIRKMSSWVVYGGDLCEYKNNNELPEKQTAMNRIRKVIPEMQKILTFTQDEDKLLHELFPDCCPIGKYMYYQPYNGNEEIQGHETFSNFLRSGLKTAVIGNSGADSSRHIYVIEALAKLGFSGQLLLPVSYNLTPQYHQQLITACEKYFPGRYYLQTELLENNDYFSVLRQCDFLFMGHFRQQAGQHWMFAFFHGLPIYGVPNSPFVNMLDKKGFIWGNIEDICLSDEFLNSFSVNKLMFQKYYGLEAVKELWRKELLG